MGRGGQVYEFDGPEGKASLLDMTAPDPEWIALSDAGEAAFGDQ